MNNTFNTGMENGLLGVILAAGMAKRLRPLTDKCPKCLLAVGERTLLQRTVDAMLKAGINELVVVTGYRAEMIREFLTNHYPTLNIHFIDNPDFIIYDLFDNACIFRIMYAQLIEPPSAQREINIMPNWKTFISDFSSVNLPIKFSYTHSLCE